MVRALYTNGARVMAFDFDSEASCYQWDREVKYIKGLILAINDVDIKDGETRDYSLWIQAVNQFRARVGDAMVPEDIRLALDNTEEGLGLVRSRPWRV